MGSFGVAQIRYCSDCGAVSRESSGILKVHCQFDRTTAHMYQ